MRMTQATSSPRSLMMPRSSVMNGSARRAKDDDAEADDAQAASVLTETDDEALEVEEDAAEAEVGDACTPVGFARGLAAEQTDSRRSSGSIKGSRDLRHGKEKVSGSQRCFAVTTKICEVLLMQLFTMWTPAASTSLALEAASRPQT